MRQSRSVIEIKKKPLKNKDMQLTEKRKWKKIEHIKKLLLGDFKSKYKYFRQID